MKYTKKLKNKELFVTDATNCSKFSHNIYTMVEELTCNHEEADTRMLLHVPENIDVLVLPIFFCSEIGANLFMQSICQPSIII